MNLQWQHPFSAIVTGPSASGKSVFVLKFLENLNVICNVQFSNIYWHYAEWSPNIRGNLNVIFKEGLPYISEMDTTKPNLVIIDDLMREYDSKVVDLFTKGCHHRNVSVFFITQNIFQQGRGKRDISL